MTKAMTPLGSMYESGRGVPRDSKRRGGIARLPPAGTQPPGRIFSAWIKPLISAHTAFRCRNRSKVSKRSVQHLLRVAQPQPAGNHKLAYTPAEVRRVNQVIARVERRQTGNLPVMYALHLLAGYEHKGFAVPWSVPRLTFSGTRRPNLKRSSPPSSARPIRPCVQHERRHRVRGIKVSSRLCTSSRTHAYRMLFHRRCAVPRK